MYVGSKFVLQVKGNDVWDPTSLSHSCSLLIADIIDGHVHHNITIADLVSLYENGDDPSLWS